MIKQHTPGHWGHRQHTGNNSRVIIGQDLSPVGIAYELPDARLIAAAPDLLEALTDAEFLLRKAAQLTGPMQDSFKRSATDARAAIAKATGEA